MRSMFSSARLLLGCLFVVGTAWFSLGCQPPVQAEFSAFDRGGSPGPVQALVGVYGAGCSHRQGEWSLYAEPFPCAPLVQSPVSVETNNSSCELKVTGVIINCQRYETRGIPLQGTYHPYGFPFFPPNSCTPAFYANIALSDPSFGSSPLIKTILASDPNKTTAQAVAQLENAQPFVVDMSVPAPDYTADTSGLVIQIDANRVVIQASGIIGLIPGLHPGQSYIVVPRLPPSDRNYAGVHATFLSHPALPITTPVGAGLFHLLNTVLPSPNPIQFDIIIANTQVGVTSYEVITTSIYAQAP